MTREPPPGAEPEPEPEDEPGPQPGHLRPTRPGTLAGCALAGLVLGWLVRPVSVWLDSPVPRVGWLPVVALYLMAAILALAARTTHDAVQRRHRRLPVHEAVNRLVLGKACALGGALVAGGYLGHALSWVGVESEIVRERLVASLAAAGGAALMTLFAVLLERACRVPGGDQEAQ